MTVVLDTHAWLWWTAEPERLSARARRAIEQADRVAVCTISCWEVAMLVRRGRIALDREVGRWVRQALLEDRVEALALTPEIAVDAALIDEGFTGDPADRIIYATALGARASLVTRDRALRSFDSLLTVW